MDRRVVRTVNRIKKSFIDLLQEEDFGKITVKMICDAADIERKTFYLHFKDKYDLLDKILEDKMEHFREHVNAIPNVAPADFYYEALNFYDRNKDIFHKVYKGRGSVPIRKKVQQYVLKRLEMRYGENHNPAVMNFVSAGISGVFEAYVTGKLHEDKRKIANDIANLVGQAREYLDKNEN